MILFLLGSPNLAAKLSEIRTGNYKSYISEDVEQYAF